MLLAPSAASSFAPASPPLNNASRKSSPCLLSPLQSSLRGWKKTCHINQELKRRTRVARVFPNEPSLLRLITALLCETSEEWETGKIYLNMQSQHHPSV
jgi:hypothetical protein